MYRLPTLNPAQLDRLSEILGNSALLIVATFVFPALSNTAVDTNLLWTGVVVAMGCIFESLYLLKKRR